MDLPPIYLNCRCVLTPYGLVIRFDWDAVFGSSLTVDFYSL
jgi:hypothetical protein